ncbi:hypothetical protein AALP_AA8G494800 [Arabis alpina]|uniref:HTH La-type RNA-binding domain-containing protein n=1 Tax=Arabis alpina TaxID=50452 RepID=A0A087GEG7_ARAAL|nr:hypothetical protein AALP_AA8G494800 [Arabis alpina]
MMATTAANSASPIPRYSIDSSMSRSRPDSSPWMPDAIHHDPAPSDNDIAADKKPVWNKPSNTSSEVGPVMGAASWPALSLSSSNNKSPSSTTPQVDETPLNSTPDASAVSIAATTSSDNHNVNGQKKPFKRNNTTPSSSATSNISNAAPLNNRDQNHTQRAASYGSGPAPQFRNSNRNHRNTNAYPRNDGIQHGHRRNYEHGNQNGFPHRNYNGRDMHLQPQRGFGMMRPQMPMGPPSFPATSAQYMAAPHIGSYGGPMIYPDYAPHILMPPPPPGSMALVGPFPPLPMYLPSIDAMLYSRILTQVEYYFSADNLSTDKHLKEQMNDEGWVPVRVIAGFRRLAEMTNDIQTILEALRSSEVVEIKGEAIRRRGDWDKYLLPRERSSSRPVAGASNNASSSAGASNNASSSAGASNNASSSAGASNNASSSAGASNNASVGGSQE